MSDRYPLLRLFFGGLIWIFSPGVGHAQTACVPEPSWSYCQIYDSTGADQTFTVPSGVTSVHIKAWGAAGGGGYTGFESPYGGAGGYASGDLTVSAGSVLTLIVGKGGAFGNGSIAQASYGGGGAGGSAPDRYTGNGGGGRSAILSGGVEQLTAGGGGGAASATAKNSGTKDAVSNAGAGGQNAGWVFGCVTGTAAVAGSTSTGGARGGGAAAVLGTNGSREQGGTGGPTTQANSGAGGGGGGGYYGGGGGSGQNYPGICSTVGYDSTYGQEGAGAGGANFAAAAIIGSQLVAGNYQTPAMSGDALRGNAGSANVAAAGADGRIVLQWNSSSPVTLQTTKTSLVRTDPINLAINPKAIPGATIQYCITVTNPSGAYVRNVTITDNIPGQFNYMANTMKSGQSCAGTLTDASASTSVSGTTITLSVGDLGPTATVAFVFDALLN